MKQAFSLQRDHDDEPRALPWDGMKHAFGVSFGMPRRWRRLCRGKREISILRFTFSPPHINV
jgi:hypothetical protein